MMLKKTRSATRHKVVGALLVMLAGIGSTAHAQSLEWGATRYFQYNIENVVVTPNALSAGSYDVKVVFSVTNPTVTGALADNTWDIKNSAAFRSAYGASLALDITWDPGTDITGTGSENATLTSISTAALGSGAASPVRVAGLQNAAAACLDLSACPGAASLLHRYVITRTVRPIRFVSPVVRGRVALEGRPVCSDVDPAYACPPPTVTPTATTFVNVPVRSAAADFTFAPVDASTAMLTASPRRPVVDIRKCQACHDGQQHGDTVVPRLSLHGGNRNENLAVCVVCHNPNQTDVPYRYLPTDPAVDPRVAGPETPIDFKTMVHSIHAGEFREKPFVVIGFRSSVNDFSHVKFPGELRDCLKCHVEVNGKGTFELPLAKSVLGTTVNTRSTYRVTPPALRTISVNPTDDVKISPTAAVCSSCHDKAEVRTHMIRTGGASFSTKQSAIGTTVIERCANCHGPGKDKDVRRAHEVDGD
jgi:OmcA/MtrC family decaheme c-type cytochrome